MTDPALTEAIRNALIDYIGPCRALDAATKACVKATEAYWERAWQEGSFPDRQEELAL